MADEVTEYRFPKDIYTKLCETTDLSEFKAIVEAVSDEEKSKFGPTTFSPPPSAILLSPLATAAGRGDLPTLEYLFETYPVTDVNALGLYDYCRYDNFDNDHTTIVKIIDSPLTAACRGAVDEDYAKTVEYLVGKGANVNHVTEVGATSLMLLASRRTINNRLHVPGYESMMKFLLDNGANIDRNDQFGNSLLSCWQSRYAKFALEQGADVLHRNAEGLTALHMAARYGYKDTVKVLLDSGMSPMFASATNSARPDYIPCPLYIASASERETIVSMFVERDGCPPVCVVDAYLMLDVSIPLNQNDHRKYLVGNINYINDDTISKVYPSQEGQYEVELNEDQMEALWLQAIAMRKGQLLQCALVTERCLGARNLKYADLYMIMGYELIQNKTYEDGERVLEQAMKSRKYHYERLSSHPDFYYGNPIVDQVRKDLKKFLEAIIYSMDNEYIPNFIVYINYGINSLDYARKLSAKAASNKIFAEVNYRDCFLIILRMFVRWSSSNEKMSLCLSNLRSFIDTYLCYPEEATAFCVPMEVKLPGSGATNAQVHSFLETILEAGVMEDDIP